MNTSLASHQSAAPIEARIGGEPDEDISAWVESLKLKLAEKDHTIAALREENERLKAPAASNHKTTTELAVESTRRIELTAKPIPRHVMADQIAQHETTIARLQRELARYQREEARLRAAVQQCRHYGLRTLADETDWAELLTCYGGNGQEASAYVAELAAKSDRYEAAEVVREWERRG